MCIVKYLLKRVVKQNPTIIKYANIIGRSPSTLNMKVGNFGRLDPELKKQGIIGLGNGSKLDEVVWDEFNGNLEKLAYESELLIAEFQNKKIEELIDTEYLRPLRTIETVLVTRANLPPMVERWFNSRFYCLF